MTKEEAIEELKDTLYDERTPNNYIQAVRIAREALENQKSVIEELEKIKEEIQGLIDFEESCCGNTTLGYSCLRVINESIEAIRGNNIEKKYETEVITRGNCMMCGKELTEGLFFCKECEEKANSRK